MKILMIAVMIFNVIFLLAMIRHCYWKKRPVSNAHFPVKKEGKSFVNPLRAIEKTCPCCGKTFWVTSDYKEDLCRPCIKANCGIGL